MESSILHCDLNSFYASVECVHNPALQFVPMAVAGDPKNRHGIILAKNELAKRFHVQTAETIWQAKRKCPDLILVPPRHGDYVKYSRLVNALYCEFSDLVEPYGIDESWLDVSGVLHLFGSGEEIAATIRKQVHERFGLTVSVGVSFNKAFAKLGSDYRKPDATTVITRENYKDLVWPLPASALLYVGKAAQAQLQALHIESIGELAQANRERIIAQLGKLGATIHDYANGIDLSPVKSAMAAREVKSVGKGLTFPTDLRKLSELRSAIFTLSDVVAARLRRYALRCSSLSLSIKTPDFKTISRQKALEHTSHLTQEIANAALALLQASWSEGSPVRSLTITAMQLSADGTSGEQLSLFEEVGASERAKQERLASAVDHIREKYGKNAIVLAAGLTADADSEEDVPLP